MQPRHKIRKNFPIAMILSYELSTLTFLPRLSCTYEAHPKANDRGRNPWLLDMLNTCLS